MSNTLAPDKEILIASSPPFPRIEISQLLTKPVPVRGTPVTTRSGSENNTPEMRAATFSPQSSFSAFKPIQSPILSESTENISVNKSNSSPYHRKQEVGATTSTSSNNTKFRHRSRSFMTNPHASQSSPQLDNLILTSPINLSSTFDKDNAMLSFPVSYQSISQHRLVRSSSDVFPHTSNKFLPSHWEMDGETSSYCDYSDIDVAEIEVN